MITIAPILSATKIARLSDGAKFLLKLCEYQKAKGQQIDIPEIEREACLGAEFVKDWKAELLQAGLIIEEGVAA